MDKLSSSLIIIFHGRLRLIRLVYTVHLPERISLRGVTLSVHDFSKVVEQDMKEDIFP